MQSYIVLLQYFVANIQCLFIITRFFCFFYKKSKRCCMNSWDRLSFIIKQSGLSVNAFAVSIGLKRAENLYRIKRGKNSISRDLAEMITTKYCNFSRSWLLTGEGAMFVNESVERVNDSKKVPFFDHLWIDSEFNGEELPPPLYYIDVPILSNCDFATLYLGESMKPEMISGSIVTLKEVDVDYILPGEIYLIVTDKYSTIKYIRTIESDDASLRLVPRNKEDYDDAIISKAIIRRLYMVKGIISTKVL